MARRKIPNSERPYPLRPWKGQRDALEQIAKKFKCTVPDLMRCSLTLMIGYCEKSPETMREVVIKLKQQHSGTLTEEQ